MRIEKNGKKTRFNWTVNFLLDHVEAAISYGVNPRGGPPTHFKKIKDESDHPLKYNEFDQNKKLRRRPLSWILYRYVIKAFGEWVN